MTKTKRGLPQSAGSLMFKFFRGGSNKELLSDAERQNLANIKASLRNKNEDGFTGGESGISHEHFGSARLWLENIIAKYNLQPIIYFRFGVF
jgi:hypothetical protein